MRSAILRSTAVTGLLLQAGCGLYVPSKNVFHANDRDEKGHSYEGKFEANLVGNIRCELQNALYNVATRYNTLDYLGTSWGTQITLKLTWDEQSELSPGASYINPMSSSQSFALGLGASTTAHATRVETISFFFVNSGLINGAKANIANNVSQDCSQREQGVMIESDLHIGEFVNDQATLADTAVATTLPASSPQFSTFQSEITFVASFGGNITPTWKLTRFTANTSSNLLSATRTTTGDILITLGPLATDDKGRLLPKLGDFAASEHIAGLIGSATASQINSRSR